MFVFVYFSEQLCRFLPFYSSWIFESNLIFFNETQFDADSWSLFSFLFHFTFFDNFVCPSPAVATRLSLIMYLTFSQEVIRTLFIPILELFLCWFYFQNPVHYRSSIIFAPPFRWLFICIVQFNTIFRVRLSIFYILFPYIFHAFWSLYLHVILQRSL